EVLIAGRKFTQQFSAAPNLRTAFTWDGKDAYNRALQGEQVATIRIGYVYDAVYQTPAQLQRSFAALSGIPLSGNRARNEVTLWQIRQAGIGGWDDRSQGLGGWSLDVHHVYDPKGKVLYMGNGERRSTESLRVGIISTVAGCG